MHRIMPISTVISIDRNEGIVLSRLRNFLNVIKVCNLVKQGIVSLAWGPAASLSTEQMSLDRIVMVAQTMNLVAFLPGTWEPHELTIRLLTKPPLHFSRGEFEGSPFVFRFESWRQRLTTQSIFEWNKPNCHSAFTDVT
jgi:hypothetical protein